MSTTRINRTILVIEDSEDDLFLLRNAFKRAKIDSKIDALTDGQQAIDYFADQSSKSRGMQDLPSLVLLDLQLPYFTGFQVLESIRKNISPAQLPVVILTSSSNAADIHRAYEVGANAYLIKPSTLEDQIRMVQVVASFWLEFNQRSPLPTKPDTVLFDYGKMQSE